MSKKWILTQSNIVEVVSKVDKSITDSLLYTSLDEILLNKIKPLLGSDLYIDFMIKGAIEPEGSGIYNTLLTGENYIDATGKQAIFEGLRKIIAIHTFLRIVIVNDMNITSAGNTRVSDNGKDTYKHTSNINFRDRYVDLLNALQNGLYSYLEAKKDTYTTWGGSKQRNEKLMWILKSD